MYDTSISRKLLYLQLSVGITDCSNILHRKIKLGSQLLRVINVHAEGMEIKDLLDRTVSRKM
jgi:hypothetical protein